MDSYAHIIHFANDENRVSGLFHIRIAQIGNDTLRTGGAEILANITFDGNTFDDIRCGEGQILTGHTTEISRLIFCGAQYRTLRTMHQYIAVNERVFFMIELGVLYMHGLRLEIIVIPIEVILRR